MVQSYGASLKINTRHDIRISNGKLSVLCIFSNPWNKGPMVNKLDYAVLGATEVDVNFNVNVMTDSNGIMMGALYGPVRTKPDMMHRLSPYGYIWYYKARLT